MAAAQTPPKAPRGFTWGELSLLPEYCRDVQSVLYGDATTNPSPRSGHWVSLMGSDFWHMHHYCYALVAVERAKAPGLSSLSRRALLDKAEGDYFYVVKNCQPDMVLMPEVWLKIGELMLQFNRPSEAMTAFENSRALQPDYWPAYTRWIDFLVGIKQRDGARKLAEQGLRYAPQSVELQTAYRSLGGDPAKIAPKAAPMAQAAEAAATPASAAQ